MFVFLRKVGQTFMVKGNIGNTFPINTHCPGFALWFQ